MVLRDRSLNEYLDRLGGRRVAPFSGATAALCGAQASALALMAAQSAPAQPRVPTDADDIELEALRVLVTDLLSLMERDAEVVDTLMGAYSRQRTTPESDATRSEAIETALIVGLMVQADMAPFPKRLVNVIAQLVPRTGPGLLADLAAAVELTRSALVIARLNVQANGALITDVDTQRTGSDAVLDMTSTLAVVDEMVQIICAAGRKRIPNERWSGLRGEVIRRAGPD